MGSHTDLFLLLCTTVLHLSTTTFAIGVNYGTLGNNLPPPSQVANFLKSKTIIDRVKIFDANPDVLRAFANSGISITVSVVNGDVPALANFEHAKQWVATNIVPFYPQTKINRIAVGNEIIFEGNRELIYNLLPAMKSLYQALVDAGIKDVQVTTPHALGILARSEPPSAAQFRFGYVNTIISPMLQFLRETNSSFMINAYPYFAYLYAPEKANYSLFKPNPGVYDEATHIKYTNMFDAMLDATYTAMKKLGFGNVSIIVGETGWPTVCDPLHTECTVENAGRYNGKLVRKYGRRKGSPLMPHQKVEIFIFSLFTENLKPGPDAERNWGLFRPDFSPIYNAGILLSQKRGGHGSRAPNGTELKPKPKPKPGPTVPGAATGNSKKMRCVAKAEANDRVLQANIDYVCGQGVDCKPIQVGGVCFEPNNVRSHASYAMNSYYQSQGHQPSTCNFSNSGVLTTVDPSYSTCKYT